MLFCSLHRRIEVHQRWFNRCSVRFVLQSLWTTAPTLGFCFHRFNRCSAHLVLVFLWTTTPALVNDFVGSSGVVSPVEPTPCHSLHRINRRSLLLLPALPHRLNRRSLNSCVGSTGGLYRAFSSTGSCAVFCACFRICSSLFLGLFCVGLALP